MKKIYIDDLPTKTGHSSRGMGMYTSNLISSVKRSLDKSELEFSKKNYDLIHIPYFDLYFNTLKNMPENKKIVVTIPDLIPLIYKDHYPAGIKGKLNLLRQINSLSNADAIITISETSKKDIVRILDIDPEKIHVTYLAPNFKFKKNVDKLKNIKLPKEFVLYVGDVNFNKNLLTLCRAVKKANKKLVIVGKQAVETDYDRRHIETQPLVALQEIYGNDKDIIRLGFLSNEELNVVWNKATVYCQPSLYEGFGLPVLEAMQASVPVLASKTQALSEIGQDACLYFDPYNENELSEKIIQFCINKSLREKFIDLGQQRVRNFSWQKMADEVISIYLSLLK